MKIILSILLAAAIVLMLNYKSGVQLENYIKDNSTYVEYRNGVGYVKYRKISNTKCPDPTDMSMARLQTIDGRCYEPAITGPDYEHNPWGSALDSKIKESNE